MDENVEATVTELAQRSSETEIGKEGCRRYLPQDIVHNILARLPAKSMLRFKTVCKNWRDMITELDAIGVQQSMSKVTIIYRTNESKSLFFKLKNKDRENCCLSLEADYIWAKKACDKFVLFSCQFPASCAGIQLVVYDTITDRFRQLPKIPFYIVATSFYDLSLVYDASAKTCKVVVFNCTCYIETCCIYTFNDNEDQWGSGSKENWRILKLPCLQGIMTSSNSSVDVNGVLYWIARANFIDHGALIQPMDIATEKFMRFIKVPCQSWIKNCNLLKIKESLCFMNTASTDELHIWVLKNSVESLWILQHKISLSSMIGRPTSLSSFIQHRFHPWLVVEGSGNSYILVTIDGLLAPYWYNLETKELRQIALDLGALNLPEELRRLAQDYNISKGFYLRTILFIDDLGPDIQKRLAGFVAKTQRQRDEEEGLRRNALLRQREDEERVRRDAHLRRKQ
ncbi:hypothetical protein KPL70_026545 [Citrus sinensis]|uniref:F-box protein At1g53790 n=1 Tax=Citrus clementina TaxID=85681 RepID=UPI000763AB26|nr:F-box protein At1g53790 [Citrus x clementina]XP_015382614.1 F-box protein At1g53790-like [Citrus sinensis]KAH9650910.1 hypothetical protein KPL70_026545 [Citrus sinensis]